MQQKYYDAHPANLITVEKGREYPGDGPGNNVYSRAAAAFKDWEAKNLIAQDASPSFYAYTQEFTVPGTTERRTRRGFIGAGRLEEYSAGVIFRHEHTLSGPKADRLELLRNTRTHTGQLFMLYSDPRKRVDAILAEVESAGAPATEVRDEYDVIYGQRVRRDDGWRRVLAGSLLKFVVLLRSRVLCADPNVPYRLMHTEILPAVLGNIPSDFYLANVALAVHGTSWLKWMVHRSVDRLSDTREQALGELDKVGLAHRRDVVVRALSYGERRQLELALAMASRPRVLLLDEPTAGLAPAERQRVSELIADIPRAVTVILIEHDMSVVMGLADEVTVLHRGKVMLDGPPEVIQGNAEVREVLAVEEQGEMEVGC